MQQQQQLHQQQSPSKPNNNACFKCHQLGHWANNCPQNTPTSRSPNTRNRTPVSLPPSSSNYPKTHCPCGVGICEIRVSTTNKNPNRCYYCCPGKFENHCYYFKWCDMLRKEDILLVQPKPFPKCACKAGVCRIEEGGPNSGLSYFVCHIQKGYGACNFRQQIPLGEDQELDYLSPEEEKAIDALMCALDFSEDVWMESEVNMPPESPGLHLHSLTNNYPENNLTMELIAENDQLPLKVNSSYVDNVKASANTVVATLQNPISRAGFNMLNSPEEKTTAESAMNEFPPKQQLLEDDIIDALESLYLQKDTMKLLSDSMDPKEQENVTKGHRNFAPVDYLQADYGLFHLQVMEYSKQATAHACIEQAIKDDPASRAILDRYTKEKARFEEIFRSFCRAMKDYVGSNSRLMSFREKVVSVGNVLDEWEEEEWCCEVENAAYKENLLNITKRMSECKESMQAAYQEMEDALKLLKT